MRAARGMGAIAPSKIPKAAKGGWIKAALDKTGMDKPGVLHREMGIPVGEKIPARALAAAAKKSGLLGQRARLAETFRGFKK